MKPPIDPPSLMLRCACGGEAVQLTFWDNEDPEDPNEIWVSIWQQGFDNRLCWRERFRWCWNILRTGKPWADNIILNPDQASQVSHFISQHVKSTQG